jgi:hypothetical protein
MKTREEFIKELWHDLAGQPIKQHPSLESLRETEWCEEFELYLTYNPRFIQLMKNRMIMGSFRYGLMAEQDYGRFDLYKIFCDKINLLHETKNLECLVDAANVCLIRFVHNKRTTGKNLIVAIFDANF